MKRYNYVRPANLPALIPDDAFPTTILVHPDTWAVKERLVTKVMGDVFPADVVAAYAETMLRLWSVNGQPTAAAVLPRSSGKSSRRLPLSARLLWFLIIDSASRKDLVDLLPLVISLIRHLSTALRATVLTETFPVLLQSPEPGANDLFRLHWELHPLRIYTRIGARVHRFLVRELDAGKSVSRLLTPITRIAAAFPHDRPPPPVHRLDYNEPAARGLYKQVQEIVADLPNLFAPGQRLAADSTQPKYVHQFMLSLDIAGFSFRGSDLIVTPGARVPQPPIDALDTDPAQEPGDPLAAYADRLRRETEEEGILVDEPLPDSAAELAQVADLEGLHPDEAFRRRAYVRQRATMHHDFRPGGWSGVTSADLALGYAALLEGAQSVSDVGLSQMADLLLYHLLVVTGRPWRWLISAQVGGMPEPDEEILQPAPDPSRVVFDPQRFAFFFTPVTYPALGQRLRPPRPDEEGDEVDPEEMKQWRQRWRDHVRIYDQVSLVRALPLDPSARLLISIYLERRRQAIQAGPLDDALPPSPAEGPLLVTRDGAGPVRPFGARDAAALVERVNDQRRLVRPDAPAVTRPRLRREAVSRLLAKGLDRVAVHVVTGRHLPGLRAPLFYTLLSSDDLADHYHQAASALSADLGRVYERVRPEGVASKLPWETALPPEPGEPCPAWRYGALYHPRREHVQSVVQALLDNARRPPDAGVEDPATLERARHDALTTLACYLLTMFAGLRVGEVATMRRLQIDLFGAGAALAVGIPGLIAVQAKSDRFYEEYRVIPVASLLVPLLAHVLERSARASGSDGPHDPAFWFYRSLLHPIPARRRHLWRHLDGIARAAGLTEGAPRWHSARHFLRTFLYRQGVDERTIDYALGHQSEGREPGNPFRPSDLADIFAAYQQAASNLAHELELDFDGLW